MDAVGPNAVVGAAAGSGSVPNSSSSLSFFGDALGNNPYFGAGFGLMGVGAVLAVLRRGALSASTSLRRRLLVSLELTSKDRSYQWFLLWMSRQHQQQANLSRGLRGWKRLLPQRSHQLSVETSYEQHDNGTATTKFSLVPGPGTHYLHYRDVWMQIVRERNGKLMDLTSGTPWETIVLTTLSRDRNVFTDMLKEAREMAMEDQIGKIIIYTSYGPDWRPFGQPRRRRNLTSVILDKEVKDRVLHDLKDFLKSGPWYTDRGIPYRRGYLLYGTPGSGKTSFIQALAGSLDYNICLLNLAERGLTDDRLNHLLSNTPERSITLLEDVDAAFGVDRGASAEEGFRSSVTFSGLLNALDGVASAEERIIFMTTNHPERLDPALIRPGRVDVREELGHATEFQVREMFRRFYSDRVDLLDAFVEEIGIRRGAKISMAALQGHFVFNKSDPERAIATAKVAFDG